MTEGMWGCPRCKKKNELWRNWCQSCTTSREEALAASRGLQPTVASGSPPPGSRQRRPLGFLVVLIVLALVGAGAFVVLRPDDASKAGAATPETRTPEQIFTDARTAQAAQLTLADFPAGWHTEPRSPNTDDAGKKEANQAFVSCMDDADAGLLVDNPDAPGTAKTDKFVLDGGHATADAEITLRPSIDAVEAEWAVLQRPHFAECFGGIVNAAMRQVVDHPAPGREIPASVSIGTATGSTIDLPGLHAAAVGVRAVVVITGPGGTVKEVFDFVFARKGRAELSLALFNVDEPFPTDLAVQLTNAMTDRTPGV